MPETAVTTLQHQLLKLRAIGLTQRDFERLSCLEIAQEALSAQTPLAGAVTSERGDAPIDGIDAEKRIVSLSFSNEDVIPRWFGNLKLDHSPGAVRLDRLNNGAPFLLHHDQWNPLCHVGTVLRGSARIDNDRVGRADIHVASDVNEYAKIAFADMQDKIRTKISALVILHKLVLLEEREDGPSLYLAADWEPAEISLLPVPAIDTIGVGLSWSEQPLLHPPVVTSAAPEVPAGKGNIMPEELKEASDSAVAVIEDRTALTAAALTERNRKINALGRRWDQLELAAKFIDEEKTFDQFRDALTEALGSRAQLDPAPRTGVVGLSEREVRRFSLIALANYLADPTQANRKLVGLELEATEAAAKYYGKDNKDGRVTIPTEALSVRRDVAINQLLLTITDLQERRERAERFAISSATGESGGYLVGKQMGSLVDLLRELTVLGDVGATYIGDLVGDYSMPKLGTGMNFYWVGEEEDATASAATFQELELHPRTAAGVSKITRKMRKQSSYDVELVVRGDAFAGIANAIQIGVFNGVGGLKNLHGILKVSGIGDVAGGTNGAAPTYAHMVQLEGKVAIAKALNGRLAYVTNNKVRSQLRQTAESATMAASGWVWKNVPGQSGVGDIGGYPAFATGDVPSTLVKNSSGAVCSAIIFGAWQHLIIGLWGGVDIEVNSSTYAKQGALEVTAFQDVDSGLRHVGAFAAMQDALTASA